MRKRTNRHYTPYLPTIRHRRCPLLFVGRKAMAIIMNHRITAVLCTLFLLFGSGLMTAAAADNPKIAVELSSTGKSANITVEGISTPTYSAQITFQTGCKAGELTFTAEKTNAYTVIKDAADSAVTLYLDATQLLNGDEKLILGTLKANQKLSIGKTADLILVNRSLEGTTYSDVPITISEEKDEGGNGGGGNSGSNKPNTKPNSSSGITTAPSSSSAANKFTDIETHWAKPAITFVAEKGLFQGMSENEFAPNANMTRAMFVTVLQRFGTAVDTKWTLQSKAGMSFSDVSGSDWYANAVAWASGAGVVNGMEDGTFAPNAAITREQMAVMIVRFADLCGVNLPQTSEAATFTDAAQIQSWATDAVVKAQRAGLIQGHPDGNFAPQTTATRAEVATIMQRLVEKTK